MNKAPGKTADNPYSPSQLNQLLKNLLENEFDHFWLSGEVAEYYQAASGHQYFLLKDDNASIRCVFFRHNNRSQHPIEIGDQVLMLANTTVYTRRGDLQVNVLRLQPLGTGLLALQFQELRKKLEQIGLFSKEHKKNLPKMVTDLAIVTSRDGAALQDILQVFKKKNPLIKVTLYHSLVQGSEAAQMLIQQLRVADNNQHELIVLSRGGGSIEDLWCFNDENLCMQIFNTVTPIATAIGHQTDTTLADFTADQFFHTPTAAAEALAGDFVIQIQRVHELQRAMQQTIRQLLIDRQQRLDLQQVKLTALHPHVIIEKQNTQILHLRQMLDGLAQKQLKQHQLIQQKLELSLFQQQDFYQASEHRLNRLNQSLHQEITEKLHQTKLLFNSAVIKIEQNSPLKILAQGYSHTKNLKNHQTVTHSKQLKVGSLIETQLKSGKIRSLVKELYEDEDI
ncbi:exodeoxyribonuclease VII large subunit [Marinicella sp. W31]|uniref:exodeoxyribonuclease VII large subunit n=1 Tax=Marinicella sp. W31 TaxID=3023713 RepID=UPI0037568F39